jgi:hypothetical protein
MSFLRVSNVKVLACSRWAEEVTTDARYDHIVRDASAADVAELGELPESW